MFANTRETEPALGAAIKAASMALTPSGGRMLVFQSSLAINGPGSLKNREDPSLLGTAKEKTLFVPQHSFYKDIATLCVQVGDL